MTPSKPRTPARRGRDAPARGAVYLVGAGPGDPGLITVRGLGAIRQADVVIHDRDISPELLDHAPVGCEVIRAGEDSAEVAADRARAGKTVVRLGAGDPFAFGTGAPEAEWLVGHGIAVEVVPGVGTVSGAGSVCGVPLSFPGIAGSVAIVAGRDELSLPDWQSIAGADTVAVLGDLDNLIEAAGELIAGGKPLMTPAAVVAGASLPQQRTVVAHLDRIVAAVRAAKLPAPFVALVGDVAGLRAKLGGWDTRPLSGAAVLVTRPEDQAAELSDVLRELGAEAVESPAIRILDPRSWAPVDRAIASIASYDWIVFTSANGVRQFVSRLPDARAFGPAKIAAIGPGTSAALARIGVRADLVPESFTTRAVGKAFPRGKGRVLLARADVAEADLEATLERKGWSVERVVAYRIRPVGRLDGSIRAALQSGRIDAVTFASAGTARAFLSAFGRPLPEGVKVACIGPVTARAVKEAGVKVDAVAKEHTVAGLAAAVVAAAGRR